MSADLDPPRVGDPTAAAANAATGRPRRTVTGVVETFDDDRGLGTIEGADGAHYVFHAVELADGSRRIDVGTAVSFERLARYGQVQAARVSVYPAA